ncbi:hypothetical protein ANN_00412 [Periplaneta americana]|uniref:Uncharacterized protein n=1 Tax=Periplaneta americana TaxID=6978 RepID=A0ABQ8TRV7_PERAM|nr:hypothetical protein ANN_00412 [Periplaneta americana]
MIDMNHRTLRSGGQLSSHLQINCLPCVTGRKEYRKEKDENTVKKRKGVTCNIYVMKDRGAGMYAIKYSRELRTVFEAIHIGSIVQTKPLDSASVLVSPPDTMLIALLSEPVSTNVRYHNIMESCLERKYSQTSICRIASGNWYCFELSKIRDIENTKKITNATNYYY